MKKIGITGPIGSGKSYVSKLFNENHGIPIFDSDNEVKELYVHHPFVKHEVIRWLGNEAYVYETVPPERLKRSYFIKRGLLRGVSEARLKQCSTMNALKSLFACLLYTSMLPLLFVLGHHLFMKYLIRDCDHIGKLLALCGIDVLKERDF